MSAQRMRIYGLAGGNVDGPRYQRAEAIQSRYSRNIFNSAYGTAFRRANESGLGVRDAMAYNRIYNEFGTQQVPCSVYMGLNNG